MSQSSNFLAPYGRIVTGNVLDCNKASLERALKFYDPQLYLKWNPKKCYGYGCWEIRRTPNHKEKIFQGVFEGHKIFTYEYRELDIVHHVMDLPFLTHRALEKLRAMDTWNDKNWVNNLEYNETKYKEKTDKQAREELKYEIRQHKAEWRDFAQKVSEGMNPGQVLAGNWKR